MVVAKWHLLLRVFTTVSKVSAGVSADIGYGSLFKMVKKTSQQKQELSIETSSMKAA